MLDSSCVIRLPEDSNFDDLDCPKDSKVLAVFPDTTSFYSAVVISSAKKVRN